ncbi:putative sporulation protein YtxC [Tissierella sp. Yu-01]|uniref:putative sporulation protein YtxC n=1 Tax=Tissierella sp. Yu-01 TaxID=3035694 RepID=UPI00240DF165|nr:putative sporulation protein YtxC [Tissierella sp. Yu-01]WFA09889.1 putative sporulation protein YtxC [Tissierella sp. Yu-01]
MESIKIVANQPKEKISELILSYPFNTKVKYHKETVENTESLIFNIDKLKVEENLIYDSLANFVQDLIIRLYMKDMINSKVSAILQNYIESNIEEIENTVYDLLIDENYFEYEKKLINDEIKDYLSENNILIIEGFIRFRSKSFENLIDSIIEKVIIDIQMETEYEDFIEMLRYYLDSQIPKIDVVNVVINENGFFLFDHKNKPIENTTLKSIIEEYRIDDISKADVLVSSLIVLAPNKVIIHIKNDNEQDLMQILKKIFTNRLSFCYSCNLCDAPIIKSDNE